MSISHKFDECQLYFTLKSTEEEIDCDRSRSIARCDSAKCDLDGPKTSPPRAMKRRESQKIFFGKLSEIVEHANSPVIDATSEDGSEKNTFKFAMAYDELLDQSLLVELISSKGPNAAGFPTSRLAKRIIPLSKLNPTQDEVLMWVELEACDRSDTLGELNLCLQYLPSAARLTVTIHQANNLIANKAESAPSMYSV